MIKTFCQYSYGGYKTLYVERKENEFLDKEVSFDETYGFPDEANIYFQFGGAKMIYRQLQDGHLALVVKEIPSIHKDGDGRALSCAVQFIGDSSDRKTLDNIALIIANDLAWFDSFFASLFSGRGGLHIKGNELEKFIDDCSVKKVVTSSAIQALANIGSKRSGVFLFIPISAMFDRDLDVTKRVCNELRLDIRDLRGVTVSMTRMLQAQKALNIQSPDAATTESSPLVSQEAGSPIAQGMTKDAESKNTESSLPRKTENTNHTGTQSEQNQSLEPVKVHQTTYADNTATLEQLTRALSLHKKVILALGLLCIILFLACLSTCSGGSNKLDNKNHNETEINQSTDD